MASPQAVSATSPSAEIKTHRLTLAVTEAEKEAALFVAIAVMGSEDDHSLLLRSMSLDEIVERARSIKAAAGAKR